MKLLHLVAIACLVWGAMTGVCYARSEANKKFTLHEISFSSTKLFSRQQLEELSSSYLNRPLTKKELNILIATLTNIYHQNGFLLSRAKIDFISPQENRARIQLIEMIININDKDLPSFASQNIISKLKSDAIFSVPQSQKTLLLLNEIPGLSAKATVKPNQQKDAFNFKIDAQQESYKTHYRIDNYGSSNNHHSLRIISEIEAYNILPYLELMGVRGAEYTGNDTVRYGEIYTESWLGSNGIRWKNRFGNVDSASPQSDLGFVAAGKSQFLETSFFIPLKRSPDMQASTSLSWRHLKSQSSIFDLDFFKDEVDVVSWSLMHTASTNQKRVETNIILDKGIDGIGGTSDPNTLSRLDGDLNFTKASIEHKQSKFIGNNGHQLIFSGEAQYAFDPLVASEEFVVGGADYARAFPFATITGDDGLALSLEVSQPRYEIIPHYLSAQIYGVVDGGVVHQKKTNIQQENYDTIASAGVGVRTNILQTTNMQFEISQPIYRNGITSREHNSPRFSFALTGEF